MSDNVLIAILAASAVVISAVCVSGGAVFAFTASNKRIDELKGGINKLDENFTSFQDLMNGKLADLDTEIAKLLDRGNR